MPHRCTKCGRVYQDGDYRILEGCECGNNTFIYIPKSREFRDKPDEEYEVKRERDEFGIECIRIIAPGQYEINIENILKRDGIIIALREEGRYVIHLPSFLKKRKKD